MHGVGTRKAASCVHFACLAQRAWKLDILGVYNTPLEGPAV